MMMIQVPVLVQVQVMNKSNLFLNFYKVCFLLFHQNVFFKSFLIFQIKSFLFFSLFIAFIIFNNLNKLYFCFFLLFLKPIHSIFFRVFFFQRINNLFTKNKSTFSEKSLLFQIYFICIFFSLLFNITYFYLLFCEV